MVENINAPCRQLYTSAIGKTPGVQGQETRPASYNYDERWLDTFVFYALTH